MTLVKSTGNKKVNLDFNKEFVNTFSEKIQSSDIQFINQTLKDLHEADIANLIENLSNETRVKLIELEEFNIDPDIFILSEISWYVLPDLKKFLRYLKTKHRNKILIHFLSTYKKKEQKYGKNFFYDLNTIKKFFNLKYIVSNNYKGKGYGNQFSYFLAKL